MIKIKMKSGALVEWKENEFTDYAYDGKMFIIVKNHIRVGFYNVDNIISIVIE